MAHTTLATGWFFVTVARVFPMVVAVFLAVASSGLATAWMALAAMKVSLITVGSILASVKAPEQSLEWHLESS